MSPRDQNSDLASSNEYGEDGITSVGAPPQV
jgi:hypothetical protein